MATRFDLVSVYNILCKVRGSNKFVKKFANDMLMTRLNFNMALNSTFKMMRDACDKSSITNLMASMIASRWAVSGPNCANTAIYNDVLNNLIDINAGAKKCVFFLRRFGIVSKTDVVITWRNLQVSNLNAKSTMWTMRTVNTSKMYRNDCVSRL